MTLPPSKRSSTPRAIQLAGESLTRSDTVAVARRYRRVEVDAAAIEVMSRSHEIVSSLAATDQPVYGVSTGFGALATTYIAPGEREELQRSLIRSHAAGMGPPVEPEVVRALLLLRTRTLCMGYSGVRPLLAQRYIDMLNANVLPVIHEHGSLGASGDLAPLAHAALTLMGEGEVWWEGRRTPSAGVLAELGWAPITLTAKEGLALINGTDGSLGMLILALDDLDTLISSSDVIAAMTVEALLGTDRPFAADLQALRPQTGQAISAARMRKVLAGSGIMASHREGDHRVQDAYSLRCAPQVNGAARDTWKFAATTAEREMQSAIDNPVVLPDGRVESCGNFHGIPVGLACDFLAIASAEVGAIAERRIDRMLDPSRSQGLPAFLAHRPGVDSGLMIAHYTAAAMTAENRRLATPASVDSIPTSAMQEDHVSMSWGAARKLRIVIANLGRILAVELLTACQALDLRAPLQPSPASAAVLSSVRELVGPLGPDRFLAPELEQATTLVMAGTVLDAVATVSEQ